MKNRIFLTAFLLSVLMPSWAQIGGDYNPESPSDPGIPQKRYTLSAQAIPEDGGSFNIRSERMVAGETYSLYAYTSSDFVFKCWMIGDEVLSEDRQLDFVMPSHDVQITGKFEYNPASPASPNQNFWSKETGDVIVDTFDPDNLSDAIYTTISGSDREEVQTIIVAGKLSIYDFSVANNFPNCLLLDLSRVTGVTEVPSYAFDYSNLESIYLPASIEKIGYYAFGECSKLASITLYAMTPPTLEDDVFYNVPEGLVVYVPAGAIGQYQDSEAWSKFTILPIQEDIRSISVSLPNGTKASDYSKMWLELTNTKSGQRMHYIMTERDAYTFANIIKNTSWNVVLRNERGDVFGKIDNVEVKDEDVSVSFASLTKPQNVSLTVKTPDGKNVTEQTQITWTDASGNYIAQGTSLSSLPVGCQLNYSVALSQDLAMLYGTPKAVAYTLKDGNNSLTCKLKAIKQVKVTGKVKDATSGLTLSGAVISASQTFGGKYSKTINGKTDANGVYTLTVYDVPTTMAFAATDYISQSIVCDELIAGKATVDMNDVSLKPISGATINVGFTYTSVDGETQNWYSDYQNVSYTLYNKTRKKAVSQFNVQYPQIVLLEEVSEGDVLELTAESKTQAFKPVKATATITANQTAEAQFSIVELGQLKVEYSQSGNVDVVASLYDASGKLVKTYNYQDMSLTVSNLADGNYTLVSMGSSQFFNSIYDLAQLPQSGLKAGTDYVQNAVTVKSGKVTTVNIDLVPKLDESKLYYTGDNTSFTVNKPSIVAGNYLTLTGHLSFKPAYESGVSNVQMIVDLPESSEFVENSVMVGNSTGSYTLNGHQLTIPMARYSDRVRFCIIPTAGGDYAPSAFAQFKLNGKTIKQPIGSANYTAKDLSIFVPSTVAKTSVPISGTAIGASSVEIFDNGVLIGQTTSLANGNWATTCELNEPYNLSTHDIYAKVTTKTGIELKSENVECFLNINDIQVSKVYMLYNGNKFVYDFQNPSSNSDYYSFVPSLPNFTYMVDFTENDTTLISDVVVNVKTSNNTSVPLSAIYDNKQNCWVASGVFNSSELPVNVGVEYSCVSNLVVDRSYIDNQMNDLDVLYTSNYIERTEFIVDASLEEHNNSSIKIINEMLDADNIDVLNLKSLYNAVYSEDDIDTESLSDDDFDKLLTDCNEEYEVWLNSYSGEINNLADDLYFNIPLSSEMFEQISEYDGTINYKMTSLTDIELQSLISSGYQSYKLSDLSNIYYKYSDNGYDFVDAEKKKRCVFFKERTTKSRTRISDNEYKGVNECAKSIAETIKTIKEKYERGSLSVKQAVSQFSALAGFFKCYYSAILIGVDAKFTSGYNSSIKEYELKIKNRNALRQTTLKRIDSYTEMLSESIAKKEDVDILLTNGQKRLLNDNLSVKEYKELSKSCEQWKQQSRIYGSEIKSYKEVLKKENNTLQTILDQLDDLKKGKASIEKAKSGINKILAKLPKQIMPSGKVGKMVGVGGKVLGFIGEVVAVWSVGCDVLDALEELKQWGDLEDAIEKKLPCPKDSERALALKDNIHKDATSVLAEYITILSSEIGAISANLAGGVPGVSVSWWIGSVANIYAEWVKFLGIGKYIDLRGDYWLDLMYLKCTGKEPDDPRKDREKNKGKDREKNKKRKKEASGNGNTRFGIDPSGYVFEAVSSNRIPGVTASCYYKEIVEDIYGDLHENVVLWDAEEYAQENPLFTDEDGMYAWDVPQGLWQVKFEKEGYETTYSEWLPVPPPQLDINIPMKQNVQPVVKSARAFQDAVEFEFDKYMMPELLTTENITVMIGKKTVTGSIKLLNEEVSREGETETFASKVRFNAAKPFDGKEVTLMVSNRVKSYAGIRMQDDFLQQFTIEEEVRQIDCKEMVKVAYGHNSTVSVAVLPTSAAAGKTLRVKSSSAMILSTGAEGLVLDKDGKAEIKVHGELPGTAVLTYSVDGYDLTATSTVNVVTILLGDVNGDGEVNAADIVVLQNYLSDRQATVIDESAADADGDGSITDGDVLAIVAIILNKR